MGGIVNFSSSIITNHPDPHNTMMLIKKTTYHFTSSLLVRDFIGMHSRNDVNCQTAVIVTRELIIPITHKSILFLSKSPCLHRSITAVMMRRKWGENFLPDVMSRTISFRLSFRIKLQYVRMITSLSHITRLTKA